MTPLEKLAFPVTIGAAFATLWVLLRHQQTQAAQDSTTVGNTSAVPVAGLGGGGGYGVGAQFTPQTIAPYTYLPPTRLTPPYQDPVGPPSTLNYLPGYSAAAVIGVGGQAASGATGVDGCGCCGGSTAAAAPTTTDQNPAAPPAAGGGLPAPAAAPLYSSSSCIFSGTFYTDPSTGCQLPIGDWCNQPVPAVSCY